MNNCALNKINNKYTMTVEEAENRIIFSFLVNPEIDQIDCVSALKKVMNKEAIKVLNKIQLIKNK